MLEALDIATIATVVGLGVKGYMSMDKRLTKVEIMQKLMLRKNGYNDDEEIENEIANELDNHKNKRR